MKEPLRILIIEDDRALADAMAQMVRQEGFTVDVFGNGEAGLAHAEEMRPALVISDVRLPGIDGLEVVARLTRLHPHMPIILTTAYATTHLAIEATKAGAYDFLEKPFQPEALLTLIRKAIASCALASSRIDLGEEGSEASVSGYAEDPGRATLVGRSPAMQEIYKQIGRVAATPVSVLIRGETGTGKELVAQALFQHSERSRQPFLAVNCLAIPRDLIESELFGHEKGAFTGAHVRRIGRFEQARHGTLFLDEIGDLPPSTQGKLLRVLQEGVIQRVGSNHDIPIQTRVLSATHAPLEQAIAQGKFREDLYYRLSTVEIRIPPLRERTEDITPLTTYLLRRYSSRFGARAPAISAAALKLLESQPWPGNVRELENVLQKALIECRGLPISKEVIQTCLYSGSPHRDGDTSGSIDQWLERLIESHLTNPQEGVMAAAQEAIEQRAIALAGPRVAWNKSRLAILLGWSRPKLYQKLKVFESLSRR